MKEALRLSPREPSAYSWMTYAGLAKIYLGRDEEAIVWLRHSIEANRNLPMSHLYLAAALALLGKTTEARASAMNGLALNASLTVSRLHETAANANPVLIAGRERVCEGLRKAGVPDG